VKTVGIVGGIGPESTIAYYRMIVASYRQRSRDGASPSVLIDSIDVRTLLDLMGRRDFDGLVGYLLPELERLARAGADFAVLAANTPHVVFEPLAARSPIPLLSIVEATADAIAARGLERVALFGTKFTMEGGFYEPALRQRGIALVLPDAGQRESIHAKYVGELLNNVFSPETREQLYGIVDDLRERHGVQGVILGGTELPLLLTDAEHGGVAVLDTTSIHVERIVAELLHT
jgi:aspartate racemase